MTKKMEDNIEYSVNRNIEKIKADGKRIGHAANNRPCIEANANVSEPKGTLHDVVGQMICPECGVFMDSAGVCICGYEHQCGGRDEACMIPGCTECGMPNADSNASAIADSVHSFVGNLDIGGCTDG